MSTLLPPDKHKSYRKGIFIYIVKTGTFSTQFWWLFLADFREFTFVPIPRPVLPAKPADRAGCVQDGTKTVRGITETSQRFRARRKSGLKRRFLRFFAAKKIPKFFVWLLCIRCSLLRRQTVRDSSGTGEIRDPRSRKRSNVCVNEENHGWTRGSAIFQTPTRLLEALARTMDSATCRWG